MYEKYSSWLLLLHIAMLPLALKNAEWSWLYWAISALALLLCVTRHRPGRILHQASMPTARLAGRHRLDNKIRFVARKENMRDNAASTAGAQRRHCDVNSAAGASHGAPVKLLTGLAHDRPGLTLLIKKAKLVVRGILHFRRTQRWLAYWNSTPMRVELAKAMPKLLPKIYRPYQSLRLRSRERIDVLISHYDFICLHGLEPLILTATRSPALLGSFTGKSGAAYELRLSAASQLEREGELILQLYCDQRPLFSIAFTFYNSDASWCVGIGCLQGPKGSDAQERVRNATRDMFGLRPKALMLRLAREIGRTCGCTKAILVGNENRVLVRQIRTGKLLADYDDFWREMGALRRPDGDYQIPCDNIRLSNPMDVPSHKRSETRKRMALTDRAIEAVLLGFNRV
jgi:uncharacterized protein VirK/YbjX